MSFGRPWLALSSAAVLATFVQCGSTEDATVAPLPDTGTGTTSPPAADAGPGGAVDSGISTADASASNERCTGEDRAAFTTCLDTKTPAECLAAVRGGDPPCDADGDGLDDALEDAMLRAYAPVFAFNESNGDHSGGNTEVAWPASAAHYTAHSRLVWRLDDDGKTLREVDANPTLATLPNATFDDGQTTRHANSPVLGEGPNFWLCLKKNGDDYVTGALVTSMDDSRSLPGGIDVFGVVHPTSPGKTDGYVVLSYMLYYTYNPFTLDDHEGDWEGGAVFVDMKTGQVAALYTDRHDTADDHRLNHLVGDGATTIKDPGADSPIYNVCSSSASGGMSGVRFWDHAGKKRHPVIYVSGGSHASYAYPGATKITGAGCVERTIVRDVHNGEGPKFIPSRGGYALDWNENGSFVPVTDGVTFRNLGEPGHLREAFSAFAGQWGCTYEKIPKSYPGPWDNQRLCRQWLTADWGAAPPFSKPDKTACTASP